MSKLKEVLNEAKKENGKSKMLPELHALDDTIEKFIQKLEDKINKIKDNPIFVRKAFQLLGDMSKEYSEFMFALRAVVNAVDRKGMVLPTEKPVGKVRDINSRFRAGDENENQPPPPEGEEEAPPTSASEAPKVPKKNKGLKEALTIDEQTHITVEVKLDGSKYETVKRVPVSVLSGGRSVLRGGAMSSGQALSQRNADIIDYLKSLGYKKVEIIKVH